mmetsp:Transcript_18353/g.38198  ORF Transcript_18353/g.38198 Transcript_18353/m.38198 type:complete len:99 (-) Transcript_18353:1403-1699(-)
MMRKKESRRLGRLGKIRGPASGLRMRYCIAFEASICTGKEGSLSLPIIDCKRTEKDWESKGTSENCTTVLHARDRRNPTGELSRGRTCMMMRVGSCCL